MKKFLLLSSIVSFGIYHHHSMAQDACPDPDKEERDSMIKLFTDLRNSSKEVPETVAEFIKLLPEGMRSNYVMMGDSRSFQTSDYENPRVIMKSKESGVLASFNGHGRNDGFRGSENLEVIMWNAPQNRFDFYEVNFPAEDPNNDPAKLSKAERRPTVTQNPASCINCHGSAVGTGDTVGHDGEVKYVKGEFDEKVLDSSDARPNWDPFPFWQGLIGAADFLERDTEETKKYIQIIKKIENTPVQGQNPNPRLSALKTSITSKDLEKILKKEGFYTLKDYATSLGIGSSLFSQLSEFNRCRISQRLLKLPIYENIKHALTFVNVSAEQCYYSHDFMPKEARDLADKYFKKRGINSFEDLVKDTKTRQHAVFLDKLSRQKVTLTKLIKKEHPGLSDTEVKLKAQKEMNINSLFNPQSDRDINLVARYRYLLEPLGVRVDNWSISIDPGTYSFGDFFQLEGKMFKKNPNMSCDQLSELSRESFFPKDSSDKKFNALEIKNLFAKSCDDLPAQVKLEDFTASIVGTINESIKQEAANVFMSCSGCHSNGINGAPGLPFDDLKLLEKEIKTTAKLDNGGLGASIMNRLNKPEGSKGHMPMGPQSLTEEQKKYVRDFIQLSGSETNK